MLQYHANFSLPKRRELLRYFVFSLNSSCVLNLFYEENPAEPVNSGGLLWKMGSGMYNITKGTVGLGVGAVKFVANTSYTAVSKVL